MDNRRPRVELDSHRARNGWFPWIRLYSPEKSLFDKTWKLPDIEKVK